MQVSGFDNHSSLAQLVIFPLLCCAGLRDPVEANILLGNGGQADAESPLLAFRDPHVTNGERRTGVVITNRRGCLVPQDVDIVWIRYNHPFDFDVERFIGFIHTVLQNWD